MKLEELEVYNQAMEIGEKIWAIVAEWDYFAKDTLGKQLVRSIDSVAANLSEGYGRYHFKDRMRFSYYSRGSLYESKAWITKAGNRGLIDSREVEEILNFLNLLGIKLNNYIHVTAKQLPK